MSNPKSPKKFTPFSHEDLNLKQELIKYAREMRDKSGFENKLASAFIYSSFAEYIAENLLANLKYFTYQGTYNQFAGVLFIDEREKGSKKKTLGQNISDLECYSFPDKSDVLKCLRIISKARNNMFHQFAKADMDTLEKIILSDLVQIQNETEELLRKIDTIYEGLRKILIAENQQADSPKKKVEQEKSS